MRIIIGGLIGGLIGWFILGNLFIMGLKKSIRYQNYMDYKYLLPSLEREADKRGLTGPERKAAIARAWELHQELQRRGR